MFRADVPTQLNVGDATSTTIVIKGDSAASSTITMFLEVEVKTITQEFNGAITASSSPQNGTTFNDVSVTVSGLSDVTQYHWRMKQKIPIQVKSQLGWRLEAIQQEMVQVI